MDGGRFKWAQTQHKSGLMVKSRRLPFFKMSSTNTLSMTTEFPISRMKEQMTQSGTFQAEVFWLAKSEGKFALVLQTKLISTESYKDRGRAGAGRKLSLA